ncbi:MAG TPA: PaaI family thioesterase [Nitrolancea sp.]|nr:PaaI family thioesterase [Nitrolancea sp.]
MEQDDLVNTATDHGCFGCGEQNPIGLRLKFHRVDGGVQATFKPEKIHEGYAHMTHGGIVATLLDEAMSWAVIDRGQLAVTAKMEVQFRHPVPIDEPLVVIARVERDRKRLYEASGELRTQTGDLLASATAVFMRVSQEQEHAWKAIYGGAKSE